MTYYAKINPEDVVNGGGIRVSIFFSGCSHHCRGCFNSEFWDFNSGVPFTQETIDTIIELMKPDYIKGLSILGGEPFDNTLSLEELCLSVKKAYPNKDIWVWTGYEFDYIKNPPCFKGVTNNILNSIDVLVDGRYEDDKRDLTLKWRGSSNQKIWRKINNQWIIDDM